VNHKAVVLADFFPRRAAEPFLIGSVEGVADVGRVSATLSECCNHLITAVGIRGPPITLDLRRGCRGEIASHDFLDVNCHHELPRAEGIIQRQHETTSRTTPMGDAC